MSEGRAMALWRSGRLWVVRVQTSHPDPRRWESAGFVLVHRIPEALSTGEPEAWEMGTYLLPAWRGTGVNASVKWLAARWVFARTGAHALLFTVADRNLRANRALAALGWPLRELTPGPSEHPRGRMPRPPAGPYARYLRWRVWSEGEPMRMYALWRADAGRLPKPRREPNGP
ncbi:MAG: GNAT family N-acetyltransferase [Alicyclobacillus sp.]|nr:GNAT family N-acetyltransferase [Alicyclobacillus sp.]